MSDDKRPAVADDKNNIANVPTATLENEHIAALVDEIELLRNALALAIGELSTHYEEWPPEQLMNEFLEKARDIAILLRCPYRDGEWPCEICTTCAARAEIERLRELCNDLHHDATCAESFCTLCGDGIQAWKEAAVADDIVTQLRERVINWEVNGEFDSNFSDAVLDSKAADEIERLRALVAIGDDLAYSLEDYATFDDEDSRARYHIKCWKHYREEARRG